MSPLRQKMIDAMRQRGFSIRTHQSYLEAVKSFSRFHQSSLVEVDEEAVARYFEHLVRERNLSASTCCVHWGALRFLYEKVLDQPTAMRKVVLPKVAGIEKRGGINALRHAFATHQLEAGMPVHKLQRALGHRSLESTMRYVHHVSAHQAGGSAQADLIADLDLEP